MKKVIKDAEGKVKDERKVCFKELRDKCMLFYTSLIKLFVFSCLLERNPFVLLYEKLW